MSPKSSRARCPRWLESARRRSWCIQTECFGSRTPLIVALAAQRRFPALYGIREYIEAVSTGSASLADKILRGAKPTDLPVEQPTKFELVINLKTAKSLRVTIPQSLQLRADRLIQ